MNSNKLIVLIRNIGSEQVKNIQRILESKNIPSVHISEGYKIPRPVGIRVKLSDYEKAKKILRSRNIEPEKLSPVNNKSARIQLIALFSIGFVTIIFLVLMILGT